MSLKISIEKKTFAHDSFGVGKHLKQKVCPMKILKIYKMIKTCSLSIFYVDNW